VAGTRDRRGDDARADRGGETSGAPVTVRLGAPWQHHALYESLGYEPRSVSIDFRGPLLWTI
jgi:hypothetical protein